MLYQHGLSSCVGTWAITVRAVVKSDEEGLESSERVATGSGQRKGNNSLFSICSSIISSPSEIFKHCDTFVLPRATTGCNSNHMVKDKAPNLQIQPMGNLVAYWLGFPTVTHCNVNMIFIPVTADRANVLLNVLRELQADRYKLNFSPQVNSGNVNSPLMSEWI